MAINIFDIINIPRPEAIQTEDEKISWEECKSNGGKELTDRIDWSIELIWSFDNNNDNDDDNDDLIELRFEDIPVDMDELISDIIMSSELFEDDDGDGNGDGGNT